MVPETKHLEFDAVTTLDDYVALQRYTMRRPRQLIRLASYALLGFVWYTVTLMVQHLFNATPSLSALADPEVLQAYMETRGWTDLQATMTTVGEWVGVVLLLIVVSYALKSRAFVRGLLRERPDIDARDRKLTQHSRCRLDEDGYTWSVPDTRSIFAWALFSRLVETRRHLFMMMSPTSGVVFPKHAMDRALVDEIRSFAEHNIAKHNIAARGVAAAGDRSA